MDLIVENGKEVNFIEPTVINVDEDFVRMDFDNAMASNIQMTIVYVREVILIEVIEVEEPNVDVDLKVREEDLNKNSCGDIITIMVKDFENSLAIKNENVTNKDDKAGVIHVIMNYIMEIIVQILAIVRMGNAFLAGNIKMDKEVNNEAVIVKIVESMDVNEEQIILVIKNDISLNMTIKEVNNIVTVIIVFVDNSKIVDILNKRDIKIVKEKNLNEAIVVSTDCNYGKGDFIDEGLITKTHSNSMDVSCNNVVVD